MYAKKFYKMKNGKRPVMKNEKNYRIVFFNFIFMYAKNLQKCHIFIYFKRPLTKNKISKMCLKYYAYRFFNYLLCMP